MKTNSLDKVIKDYWLPIVLKQYDSANERIKILFDLFNKKPEVKKRIKPVDWSPYE